jgi:prefoldin subunit 5
MEIKHVPRKEWNVELGRVKQAHDNLFNYAGVCNDEIDTLNQEKDLRDEIVKLIQKEIKQVQSEVEDLEKEDALRDQKIKELKEKLSGRTTKKPDFKPKKGDELDEMLAAIMAKLGCTVPIKRLGEGYYLFGTRKIYAKILNGKLVVRVGGGYMIFEEFIATYAEQEMTRLEKLYEKGIDPFDEQYDQELKQGPGKVNFFIFKVEDQEEDHSQEELTGLLKPLKVAQSPRTEEDLSVTTTNNKNFPTDKLVSVPDSFRVVKSSN